MAELDELDTAILRELQYDARRTNRDVAAAVGVAPTTALERTRGLRERGIITGARLEVDLAKIGRPVQVADVRTSVVYEHLRSTNLVSGLTAAG
jgi:DNA-binding Lrp family transcriptional regulator